jgi:hypothetical protein
MACFFVPLVTITLAGLPPQQIASAAGLSNFLRILGGSCMSSPGKMRYGSYSKDVTGRANG